ncbi:hypothetical protein ACJ72_02550 [Emergomyces africanus]|uniref:Uncharacterized protein n=1 Tax=Emergomyces africanus TaxID=1955775 RepID=A0A1B7P252_9EURO|nr:hypothetical protein ACJ72_02550 [Emergomyces africanus]
MGFEYVFVGLAPSYLERGKLDAEKLFIQGVGRDLQEEKETYLLETRRFQNAVSKVLSQMSTNIKYLNDLTRGINWGINAMFRPADAPQTPSDRHKMDGMIRAHGELLATISMLEAKNFTLPDKHFGFSEAHVVSRSSESCEVTGIGFIARLDSTTAANCIAAYIISKKIYAPSVTEGQEFLHGWLLELLVERMHVHGSFPQSHYCVHSVDPHSPHLFVDKSRQ